MKPRQRAYKAWRRAHSAQEKAWLTSTTAALASEATAGRPGAKAPPSCEDTTKLLDTFEGIWAPSQVATWAMATQLKTLIGTPTVARLTGIPINRLTQLEGLKLRLDAAQTRALWFLWSLILCPKNLSNTFHIETWGYFLPSKASWIQQFEAKRIRLGFADAVFGSSLDFCDTHAVPGVINYLKSKDLRIGMVDPPLHVPRKPGRKRMEPAWVEELFERLDRGETQEQVAAAMGVTQTYVSVLAKERNSILPHMIRTLRTKIRIPTLLG